MTDLMVFYYDMFSFSLANIVLFMFHIIDYHSSILVSDTPIPATSTGDFGIGQEELASLTRDHDLAALERHGGASSSFKSFDLLFIGIFLLLT